MNGHSKPLKYWWHYIPFLVLLPLLLTYYDDPWIGGLFLSLSWWLVLLLVIWAIYALIRSFKIGGWHKTLILALSALYILAAILLVAVRIPAYQCDPEKMVKHYEKEKDAMAELVSYTLAAINEGESVRFELEDGNVDLSEIGLDEEELNSIQKRLKKIRCISIDTHFPEYCDIGYKFVALGRYSFRLFLSPMNEDRRHEALNDPHFIPYNDSVVLMYGGGAAGPDTFSIEEKENFLQKHPFPSD